MQRPIWNRFATFLVWLIAAGSAVYWALQFVRPLSSPFSAAVAAPNPGLGIDAQALAKGLGGGASPQPEKASAPPSVTSLQASRFVLTGVVVQKGSASRGVALIAVDGKPPRPYRVGSPLTVGVLLHSVSAGKAMLATAADAAPALTLELPEIKTAIVGTPIASRPTLKPAAIP